MQNTDLKKHLPNYATLVYIYCGRKIQQQYAVTGLRHAYSGKMLAVPFDPRIILPVLPF